MGISNKIFLDYYVNLPIFKFENKQDIDIQIDSIVVLNHNVEFRNNIIFRSDGETWKYKELTEIDPVDYYEGTDPEMEYMPDEYVAPVLVKVNGITHRASMLTWFPLTDFATDAAFKIDLINDRLAGKEMYIARHYLKSKKWIPAINRFKNI